MRCSARHAARRRRLPRALCGGRPAQTRLDLPLLAARVSLAACARSSARLFPRPPERRWSCGLRARLSACPSCPTDAWGGPPVRRGAAGQPKQASVRRADGRRGRRARGGGRVATERINTGMRPRRTQLQLGRKGG